MTDEKDKKDGKPCDPRNYARYYDSPDGCDLGTKIKVASRYGIVTGLIAGTYDVLMYSHVVGMGPIMRRRAWNTYAPSGTGLVLIGRYARHVVPLGLMGATFAAVSTITLRTRNIDDKLNYFFGGLACGPLVALYLGSWHGVVAGGIFLGLIGTIKKEAIERDYEILHKFPGPMNTITSWKADSSLVADPRDAMIHTCGEDFDDPETQRKKRAAKRKKQLQSGECD